MCSLWEKSLGSVKESALTISFMVWHLKDTFSDLITAPHTTLKSTNSPSSSGALSFTTSAVRLEKILGIQKILKLCVFFTFFNL